MSNLERDPAEQDCVAQPADGPVVELLGPRKVFLGRTQQVRRLLPHKVHRMVGAWCFVDHYGPDDVRGAPGMWVPPHPHTGLQTVSWLFDGRILHRDSVGSEALVRPGELNIMTAGHGIAHSEESYDKDAHPLVHGAQLWVALPEEARDTAGPRFDRYADLPVLELFGARGTVMVGEVAGVVSPAPAYTPLVGADLTVSMTASIPLTEGFEYAVLVVDGSIEVEHQRAGFGELVYLGTGRAEVRLTGPGRVLLLGGEPFAESIVMWWNFIGRDHAEIVAMRKDWNDGLTGGPTGRFGVVHGFDGDPLTAPELPRLELRPRGRRR